MNMWRRKRYVWDDDDIINVWNRRMALAAFKRQWISIPRGRRPKDNSIIPDGVTIIPNAIRGTNGRLYVPEWCITFAQFCRKLKQTKLCNRLTARKRANKELSKLREAIIKNKSRSLSEEEQAFFNLFPFAPLSIFTHPSIRGIEGAIRNMYQVDEYDTLKNDSSYSREAIVERYRVFFPHAKNEQSDYPDYPWWEPIPWTIYREDTIPYLKKITMTDSSVAYRKLSNKPELAHLQPKKCPKKNIADSKLSTIYSKHWYDTTIPMSIEKYNAMLDDMISYSVVKIKDTF